MSKPLVWALQLAGLIMIMNGAIAEPRNWEIIIAGLVVAGIGGYGIRQRFKAEQKPGQK